MLMNARKLLMQTTLFGMISLILQVININNFLWLIEFVITLSPILKFVGCFRKKEYFSLIFNLQVESKSNKMTNKQTNKRQQTNNIDLMPTDI